MKEQKKEFKIKISQDDYDRLFNLKKKKELSWSNLLIYLYDFHEVVETSKRNVVLQDNLMQFFNIHLGSVNQKMESFDKKFEELLKILTDGEIDEA